MDQTTVVLFEPWSLGDAVIAVATARLRPETISVAVASRWIPLLQHALNPAQVKLIPVDLAYTRRDKQGETPIIPTDFQGECLSIRGDFRDYLAMKKMFPKARKHMNGWISFAARRFALLDIPFAKGLMPVRNRYLAWTKLAHISEQELMDSYRPRQALTGPICFHIGAQWKSKQYPELSSLSNLLGQELKIIGSPEDPLPPGIEAARVHRVKDKALVDELRSASILICNDSGPMHLAALMGIKTIVLTRTSNIREWIPPHVIQLASSRMPWGYRPDPKYQSDEILEAWPNPDMVARAARFALKN